MQTSDFTEHKSGRLLRGPGGYWAFVPEPLPPRLDWDGELAGALSGATLALGELSGAGRLIPNPHLLIGPFLRQEAVLSSKIEGTVCSLSDLFEFEAEPSIVEDVPDVREVSNYVRALDHGLSRLDELSLSLRLIKELHGILMDGVRGEHLTAGEFRRTQNWIGPPRCTLDNATYVPPPPTEMNEALHLLEKYLHQTSVLPPLIRSAAVHYQFEAIHPFGDGNGRIGRLLITLLLCKERILSEPLLYLSAYFEKERPEYYERLLAVSRDGQWNEWARYFLRGVERQAKEGVRKIDRLLGMHRDMKARCGELSTSTSLPKLIDLLFQRPAVTVTAVINELNVTRSAAQANVDKLVKANILEEVLGRKRNRVYVARAIIDAITMPENE